MELHGIGLRMGQNFAFSTHAHRERHIVKNNGLGWTRLLPSDSRQGH